VSYSEQDNDVCQDKSKYPPAQVSILPLHSARFPKRALTYHSAEIQSGRREFYRNWIGRRIENDKFSEERAVASMTPALGLQTYPPFERLQQFRPIVPG
jgi:hypothetical protein